MNRPRAEQPAGATGHQPDVDAVAMLLREARRVGAGADVGPRWAERMLNVCQGDRRAVEEALEILADPWRSGTEEAAVRAVRALQQVLLLAARRPTG